MNVSSSTHPENDTLFSSSNENMGHDLYSNWFEKMPYSGPQQLFPFQFITSLSIPFEAQSFHAHFPSDLDPKPTALQVVRRVCYPGVERHIFR
jgi:hypothetical protein